MICWWIAVEKDMQTSAIIVIFFFFLIGSTWHAQQLCPLEELQIFVHLTYPFIMENVTALTKTELSFIS